MDILNQLKSVYATLDKISVSGSENIDKLYGCFYVLTQVIQELERQEVDKQEKGKIEKRGVPVSPTE